MTPEEQARLDKLELDLHHERVAKENLRRSGAAARRVAIRNLVERHGFKLVHHPRPWEHPNPLGLVRATPYAQLCEGKIIAIQDEDHAYAITHELAHGVVGVGDDDELAVHRYQSSMLAQLFQGYHG